jgi:hypothetical protein
MLGALNNEIVNIIKQRGPSIICVVVVGGEKIGTSLKRWCVVD